jgi:hypothetical protein
MSPQSAIYPLEIPNGHLKFQMSTQSAIYPLKIPNSHLKSQMSTQSAIYPLKSQMAMHLKSQMSTQSAELSTGNPKWPPEVHNVYPKCRIINCKSQMAT